MKSFGILYKESEKSKEESQKIDLHINLWDLSSVEQKEKRPCIDFGLKIDHFRSINKIQFYFPFLVQENGIVDLYSKMKDRSIASLIFNDNDFKVDETDVVVYKISRESKDRILLKIEHNIKVETNDEYSILEIDMESIGLEIKNQLDDAYFRFRVKSPELKKILWLQSKLDNSYFESAFTSKQIIDIKINEPRNIEDRYRRACKREGYQYFMFSKVHFLLAEPASGTSTFFGKSNVSCRTLEDNEWDTYLENAYNTKDALVYHVKGDHSIEKPKSKFNCLVKSEIKDTNWKLILTYIFVVIILGACGSGLLELIKCLFGIVPC